MTDLMFKQEVYAIVGAAMEVHREKGYGFAEPDDKSKDIFIYISAVELSGLGGLNEGQRISYKIESKDGKVSAINIELLS